MQIDGKLKPKMPELSVEPWIVRALRVTGEDDVSCYQAEIVFRGLIVW